MQKRRSLLLGLALVCAFVTPLAHLVALVASGQDPVTTPISQLSRSSLGPVQTGGLILFGVAHVALAIAVGGLDRGRLWPVARLLLVASGAGLGYIAWYFITASEATLSASSANDPLWVVASLTGFAMGAMQPGLSRLSLSLGLFGVVCLGAWLLLIPLILLVNEHWLGAYERIVGGVYVVWMIGITMGLSSHSGSKAPATKATQH